MKDRLLVLTGPTGIGKSELSLILANKLNGEIISADSMQIYKQMNIGTAKIKIEEMDNIVHHMIDIVEPNINFTVSDFSENAKKLIKSINLKNKLPIVVGGTGLYINSLVYDLNFQKVSPNKSFRDNLEILAIEKGSEHLYELLKLKNPKLARGIDKNNKNRIIRALEIHEFNPNPEILNFRKECTDYNLVIIALNMNRERLYSKINIRVDKMVEKGLFQEVENLLKAGYSADSQALKAIGYKEIIEYFNGLHTYEKTIELIKQHSRNYAKRQLTWFKRDNRILWYDLENYNSIESLSEEVTLHIEKKFCEG